MPTQERQPSISTGTFIAGLWLVLFLVGSVVMYPTFMEGLVRYAQEEAPGHWQESTGLLSLISPRVMYWLCVAQIAIIGATLPGFLCKHLSQGGSQSSP